MTSSLQETQKMQCIKSKWSGMKDLDLLKSFLGIEIDRGDNFITTTQSQYAKDILRKANRLDSCADVIQWGIISPGQYVFS